MFGGPPAERGVLEAVAELGMIAVGFHLVAELHLVAGYLLVAGLHLVAG